MADTVAVMNKGRIEQLGAPAELYELPKTAFVANFLGQSNLFRGKVLASAGDSMTVDIHGAKVAVPLKRAQHHAGQVVVGIRPEKLRLHAQEPPAAAGVNTLGPGRVIDVSFSGVSTQYLVEVPGVGTVIVFAQNSDTVPLSSQGAQVWVSWHADHGFGLEDEESAEPRFSADDSTARIAVQKKKALQSELEEA